MDGSARETVAPAVPVAPVPAPVPATPVSVTPEGAAPAPSRPIDERDHLRPVPAPATAAAQGAVGLAGSPVRESDGEDLRATCTVAQLRRFIKSRPWIPLHELRRRFGIYGGDDDVSPIRVGDHTLFIGLPPAESRLMAELLTGGDVGYELSLDPATPIVVGVYPMRPVPRG